MQRDQLLRLLETLLQPNLFKDYAPNGLQVQGKARIERIVTAVTATQNVIDRALELKADALLVHHGWFWRGENPCIVRTKYQRLKTLMSADVNLLAYHLPLDAHAQLGNNALLGALLQAESVSTFAPMNLACLGTIKPISVTALAEKLHALLGQKPLILGPKQQEIERIAWCTGSAEDFFEQAIELGAQAYISGEATERTTHLARESQTPYFVCGHHATERLGIRALGDWLSREHGLECIFVDDENPI